MFICAVYIVCLYPYESGSAVCGVVFCCVLVCFAFAVCWCRECGAMFCPDFVIDSLRIPHTDCGIVLCVVVCYNVFCGVVYVVLSFAVRLCHLFMRCCFLL